MTSPRNIFPIPPPPLPEGKRTATLVQDPMPPVVTEVGPAGAFLVELLIYNGSPFKDHWAYWVSSHTARNLGVKIHATGDVRNGFRFECKRHISLHDADERPTTRVPLQWVDGRHFDERAMFNSGSCTIDNTPACGFETSAHKVKVPGKTLNAVDDGSRPGKKVALRDCQTWIVESAAQLVEDGIFSEEVAAYLHAIRQ
ncbi:hypothetical protein VTK73DRAFT_1526 [Phialemonium thermophilum]|uniref:Uncharacterized protein n=1 Tax=Phialemonium thermophilum TaxID=223376 RepID=A0ABR3X906_9PEZI